MKIYTPRGAAAKAVLFLEDEGAQFTSELANHINVESKKVLEILQRAIDKGVIGRTVRERNGKRLTVWHLTVDGLACAERIRASVRECAA